MKMSTTVDDKGRITIPKEIRDKLEIKKGNKVVISIAGNTILVRKTLDSEEFSEIATVIRDDLKTRSKTPIEFEKVI